jgi:hypothetical protein
MDWQNRNNGLNQNADISQGTHKFLLWKCKLGIRFYQNVNSVVGTRVACYYGIVERLKLYTSQRIVTIKNECCIYVSGK